MRGAQQRTKMTEYDFSFEVYKDCKACDAWGSLDLDITDPKKLEKWAKRLNIPEAFFGYNICGHCHGSGQVLDRILEDLELEK